MFCEADFQIKKSLLDRVIIYFVAGMIFGVSNKKHLRNWPQLSRKIMSRPSMACSGRT